MYKKTNAKLNKVEFPPLNPKHILKFICEDCEVHPILGLRFYNVESPEDVYCFLCYQDHRDVDSSLELRPFKSFKDLAKIITVYYKKRAAGATNLQNVQEFKKLPASRKQSCLPLKPNLLSKLDSFNA